jgi:hypothetical protein
VGSVIFLEGVETYIVIEPLVPPRPTAIVLHLQLLLRDGFGTERLGMVPNDTVPHVLALLVSMAPARFKDAPLLSRAAIFQKRRHLFSVAVCVLLDGLACLN